LLGAKGLAEANELISRDEHTHCEFACTLFKMLHSKPTELVVQKIIADAVTPLSLSDPARRPSDGLPPPHPTRPPRDSPRPGIHNDDSHHTNQDLF
jgi:hypothetical protein